MKCGCVYEIYWWIGGRVWVWVVVMMVSDGEEEVVVWVRVVGRVIVV